MAKKKEEHWSFEALRKRLTEKTEIIESPSEPQKNGEPRVLRTIKRADWENGTVFLFDPDLRKELDETFNNFLYPRILEVFQDQPFLIPSLEEIGLADLRSIEAARNALFLMIDPKRSIGTSRSPWWYVRFNLETRIFGYMLQTELLLSLPFSIEPDWVLDLLVESRSWGVPPSLSTDTDEFVLAFSWGQGRSYVQPEREWSDHLTEPFRKHIQIAKAIDRFSLQSGNRLLKSSMLQLITEMYGSY